MGTAPAAASVVDVIFADMVRSFTVETAPPRPEIELDRVMRTGRRMVAEQDRLFHQILTSAADDPDPWVGPDPTLDRLWRDPRGRSVTAVRTERREFAIRAAVADLALRVHLSEQAVRARAHRAATLAERMPVLWRSYLTGDVSEQNAANAATPDTGGQQPTAACG